MHTQNKFSFTAWAGVATLAAFFALAQACDNAAPAPPPSSSASSDLTQKKKKTTDDDDSTQQDAGDDDDSALGQGGMTGGDSSTTGSAVAEPTSFNRPGADVGAPEDKAAVKACNDKGFFYARFDDTPVCTTVALAKTDCTLDGVRAAITAAGKNTLLNNFNTMLTGATYASKMIDQCVDCPPGNSISYCSTANPPVHGGTQVWFVSSDGQTIHGSALMLSIRPYQITDDSASTTGGTGTTTTTGAAAATTTTGAAAATTTTGT